MCLNMEDGNGLFLTGELMAEMGPTLTTSSSWDGDGMCVPILRHHREGHTIDVPFIAQISEISAARDLRPEKVLLSDRMTPIVADLGAGIIPWWKHVSPIFKMTNGEIIGKKLAKLDMEVVACCSML